MIIFNLDNPSFCDHFWLGTHPPRLLGHLTNTEGASKVLPPHTPLLQIVLLCNGALILLSAGRVMSGIVITLSIGLFYT